MRKLIGIVLLVLSIVLIIPLIIVAVAIGFSGGSGFGCNPAGGPAGSGTTDTAPGGTPVYLIGDSIGVGVEPELRTKLGGKLTAQVTGAITLHDSIPKLEGDKDKIRDANSVVVELGTNLSSNFESEAKGMVNKIKAINPNAKIYWVQIFSEGSADEYRQYNDIIRGLPGVELIETKGKGITFADGEVPIGIHPSPKGYEILATLIADEVTGGGPGRSTSSLLRSLVGTAYAAPTNPPKEFIPFYQGAAAQFGLGELGPSILAALHFTETGFSTNVATTGDYVGPMAIIKSDWEDTWAVDGDKDGDKDIFDEADSIYAAAKILKYWGGSKDWRETISKYKGGSYSLADQALAYAKDHPIPATGGGAPVSTEGGEDCEPTGGGSVGGGTVSGNVQQLAKQILDLIDKGKIVQLYKSDTGDTIAQLKRAANGQKFQMTCRTHGGPKDVEVNPDILKAVIEASKVAKVDISNITDKCHTDTTSNHYDGNAIDLGCATTNINALEKVFAKYGGTNNGEVCPGDEHWHYDFLKK